MAPKPHIATAEYIRAKWLDITKRLRIGDVEVTASAAELNKLDGLNASTAELNTLVGVTATASELNLSDLSAVGALVKVKKLAISATPTGAEQDTGWDLPANAIVLDQFLQVTTAEATGADKTMDIGLKSGEAGGDADGFADGLDCSALGLVRPGVVQIAGANETYVSDFTRGAFLRNGTPVAGSNVAGDEGVYYEKPHLSTSVTARSVTYTAKSADWAEFRGAIYLLYIELG
jgi:hypothetical protein